MAKGFLGFDHIDVRVRSLAAVERFYDALLPALGLTVKSFSYVDAAGDWRDAAEGEHNTFEYFEPERPDDCGRFIGFIEDSGTTPVRTRIAFLVETPEEVWAWESRLRDIGARDIEYEADRIAYPAIFFSDPAGTQLEIVARRKGRASKP